VEITFSRHGPYDGPMSQPKRRDTQDIDFLIATPKAASCREAALSQLPARGPAADDPYTRLRTASNPTRRHCTVKPAAFGVGAKLGCEPIMIELP
jgi:hypothetical protein